MRPRCPLREAESLHRAKLRRTSAPLPAQALARIRPRRVRKASAFTIAQTVDARADVALHLAKFCCKVPSDTSAQVGRVAVRLAISIVATVFMHYIGHRDCD